MKIAIEQIAEAYRPSLVSFSLHTSADRSQGQIIAHAIVGGVLLTSSSTSCWQAILVAVLQQEAYQDLLNQCYVMAAALRVTEP